MLVNIEKQDLKNKSYLSFLRACKNNNKLILYKNRINLKIKQYFYFIKTQINLGYLAKHLTWNKTSKIILTDDSDNIESEEIKNLNKKLKVTTKKYYKYKGKYLKLKSDTSSLETELSRP